MAEMKSKVELKQKGTAAELPTDASGEVKQVLAKLQWNTNVDLDFMCFIEKKDGSKFALYTDVLSKNSKTMGDLNAFPFMTLSGDAGIGGNVADGGNVEVMKIAKISDEVAKARLVAFNYTAASTSKPAQFKPLNAKVSIVDDKGESYDALLESEEEGVASLVATLDNTSAIGCKLVNESTVFKTIHELFAAVPGSDELLG